MKSLQLLSVLHIISQSTSAFSASLNDHNVCIYDTFYFLRPTPLPTCTLAPRPSTEAPPELLTFEEWKQAQLASESPQRPSGDLNNVSHTPKSGQEDDAVAERTNVVNSEGSPADESTSLTQSTAHTRFRVPLTDRFNYASQDCTARIQSAHKGAKSPSAILSGKKDRYMLSPCASKDKFVIVELCDDVRIDTVQLANYEFFSGVFKDIRIRLAETLPANEQDWINAGVYRAKNVRGVQSFHPPEGRQKFYRYVRVEFMSHYGSEYYCPISLLRVYGLTHMEDYRWDDWQIANEVSPESGNSEDIRAASSAPSNDTHASSQNGSTSSDPVPVDSVDSTPTPIASDSSASVPPTTISPVIAAPQDAQASVSTLEAMPDELGVSMEVRSLGSIEISTRASATPTAESAPVDEAAPADHIHTSEATSTTQSPTTASDSSADATPSSTKEKQGTPSAPTSFSLISSATATPHSRNGGGESIYRIIMNRLHRLEANSSLGIRYVEEQTRSVREVVRKLEEDVGRMESVGKRQQRLLERTVTEMEKQRKDMETELRKLMSDIQTLSQEVTLEKRIGFVQLCLLICVFIFMGLTRGSRDPATFNHGVESSSRFGSWQNPEWARWRKRQGSTDSRTSNKEPKPTRPPSSHARSQSQDDPFAMDVPRPKSPIHPGFRLPRHTRQRVSSSPSMPAKLRHSSPRRVAAHLHEVKHELSRRRNQIDLTHDGSDEEGTPRIRRVAPPTIPFPVPGGSSSVFSHKGKERVEAEPPDDRELSPTTTAGGELSDDSALWEDTSADGTDDGGEGYSGGCDNQVSL